MIIVLYDTRGWALLTVILESCFWSVRSDRVHEALKLISFCDLGRKIKERNENQLLGERNAIIGWKRLKESDYFMICTASVARRMALPDDLPINSCTFLYRDRSYAYFTL